MLFGLRFNLLKDKLFNYFNFVSGDSKKFFYEVNYLINNDILVDYVYKKRFDDNENNQNMIYNKKNIEDREDDENNEYDYNFSNNKHYFTLHKILKEKKDKIAGGFYLTNKNLGLRFGQKHMLNKNDSFKYNIKFNKDIMKIKNKFKQKISDKFIAQVIFSLFFKLSN